MLSKKILRAQPSSPFSPRALLSRLLFFQEIFPLGGRASPCIFQLQIFRNRIRSILSLFFPLILSRNVSCYAICSGTDHSLSNYPTLLQFGSRSPTKRRPQCFLLLEFIIQLTLRSDDIVKPNADGSKTA